MKEKTNGKRRFPVVFAAAFVVVLAMGAIVLTGCGGSDSGSASAPEPEKIINPITGIECDSELPARPVQVSIPNDTYGAVPQSNISHADIIYEFPVEGDLTRLQAIFYSDFPDKVGPIRSVRYYFVDLATEYKVFHVGYGWGKHAKSQMNSNNVPHINGMEDTDLFYRNPEKTAPNDAYINWSDIEAAEESQGALDNQQTLKAWKFRDDEWAAEQKQAKADAKATVEELSGSDDPEDVKAVEKAQAIVDGPEKASTIKVSSLGCNSRCEWDSENSVYKRFWYDEPYVDKETGEQLEFQNILVQKVHSDLMVDPETGLEDEKGRLDIDLFAGGDAILFTNGEMITGTWSRDGVDSRTVFKDDNGQQFRFTPGKTWVYVLDQNKKLEYE